MLASLVFKKTKGTGSASNKALKTTPFGRSDAFTRGGFAIMPHATAPLSLMLSARMKWAAILFLFLFAQGVSAMDSKTTVIDELIKKENYAIELWEPRGLNPSAPEVITALEVVTNSFLKKLRQIQIDSDLNKSQQLEKVQRLVDSLPWNDFDTEEKEFLADTIAPAIASLGFDPWSII